MTLSGRSQAPMPTALASPTIAVLGMSEHVAMRFDDGVALRASRLSR
jgi:hypothetical protein